MDFIKNYTPNERIRGLLQGINPLFLVGPTGSGKDTVQQELLKTGEFYKIVTYTSRPPRVNHGHLEVEGEDYHFVDMNKAKDLADQQKFIEVTIINGYFYGTAIDEFEQAKELNKTPMLDIDVKGINSYRKLSSNFTAVFLLPTSFASMLDRLYKRYGKSASSDDIKSRLQTALDELKVLLISSEYYVLINENLAETVSKTLSIAKGSYKEAMFNSDAKNLVNQLITDISSHINSQ